MWQAGESRQAGAEAAGRPFRPGGVTLAATLDCYQEQRPIAGCRAECKGAFGACLALARRRRNPVEADLMRPPPYPPRERARPGATTPCGLCVPRGKSGKAPPEGVPALQAGVVAGAWQPLPLFSAYRKSSKAGLSRRRNISAGVPPGVGIPGAKALAKGALAPALMRKAFGHSMRGRGIRPILDKVT